MCELVISEIQIVPIKQHDGLVAFASVVINGQFYCGNIAIYSAPSTKEGFRLVFPNKKLASGQVVNCFYPIEKSAGALVTKAVVDKYTALMNNFNHIEAL